MSDEQASSVRMDPRIFEAIQLANLNNRMKKLDATINLLAERMTAVETQSIPFDRTKIYQHTAVAAGETGTVYDYGFDGYTAYIYYVGCKWYPLTHIEWHIDRVLKEDVRRTIGNFEGPVSETVRMDPPVIAHRSIRWIAHNGSTTDWVFEVVCDGVLFRGRR